MNDSVQVKFGAHAVASRGGGCSSFPWPLQSVVGGIMLTRHRASGTSGLPQFTFSRCPPCRYSFINRSKAKDKQLRIITTVDNDKNNEKDKTKRKITRKTRRTKQKKSENINTKQRQRQTNRDTETETQRQRNRQRSRHSDRDKHRHRRRLPELRFEPGHADSQPGTLTTAPQRRFIWKIKY